MLLLHSKCYAVECLGSSQPSALAYGEEYSIMVSFANSPRRAFREGNSVLSHKTDLSLVLETEQSTELDGSQAWLTQFWMFLLNLCTAKIPTFRTTSVLYLKQRCGKWGSRNKLPQASSYMLKKVIPQLSWIKLHPSVGRRSSHSPCLSWSQTLFRILQLTLLTFTATSNSWEKIRNTSRMTQPATSTVTVHNEWSHSPWPAG